jgi:hypothetical protein
MMDGRCHLTCFSFELVPLHDYIMFRGKYEGFLRSNEWAARCYESGWGDR